jgi:hypothetical protein
MADLRNRMEFRRQRRHWSDGAATQFEAAPPVPQQIDPQQLQIFQQFQQFQQLQAAAHNNPN